MDNPMKKFTSKRIFIFGSCYVGSFIRRNRLFHRFQVSIVFLFTIQKSLRISYKKSTWNRASLLIFEIITGVFIALLNRSIIPLKIQCMKNFLRLFDFLFLCCLSVFIASCSTSLESTAYLSSDNGDGTYTNPVIQADYPDPDIIRVGEDYYMVSSSFVAMPGIPVCHSKTWSTGKL